MVWGHHRVQLYTGVLDTLSNSSIRPLIETTSGVVVVNIKAQL